MKVFRLNSATVSDNPSDCLTADNAMSLECACGSKFTESVTDHVLSNENSGECLAIVHVEGVSDKFRNDHGTAGPGLNSFLGSAFLHFFHFCHNMSINKRTFFN